MYSSTITNGQGRRSQAGEGEAPTHVFNWTRGAPHSPKPYIRYAARAWKRGVKALMGRKEVERPATRPGKSSAYRKVRSTTAINPIESQKPDFTNLPTGLRLQPLRELLLAPLRVKSHWIGPLANKLLIFGLQIVPGAESRTWYLPFVSQSSGTSSLAPSSGKFFLFYEKGSTSTAIVEDFYKKNIFLIQLGKYELLFAKLISKLENRCLIRKVTIEVDDIREIQHKLTPCLKLLQQFCPKIKKLCIQGELGPNLPIWVRPEEFARRRDYDLTRDEWDPLLAKEAFALVPRLFTYLEEYEITVLPAKCYVLCAATAVEVIVKGKKAMMAREDPVCGRQSWGGINRPRSVWRLFN